MDVRRVVEIWNPSARSVGTGYLVADRLVLTAFHAVAPGEAECEVRALAGGSWAAAELLWPETPPDLDRAPRADAALLRVTASEWAPLAGEPVRWGGFDPGAPAGREEEERIACLAVGFPRAEVRDDIRDTKQIAGHVERLTGLKSGLFTVHVDRVATPSRGGPGAGSADPGPSRWAGASGAALFARGHLIGVLTEDRARDYEADQLRAVPVAALADLPGFTMALKASGVRFALADLADLREPDAPGTRTAYDVGVPRGMNNLPEPPSRHFVGRQEVLAGLARALSAADGPRARVIHGLGGVGKSTLALHYAYDHRDAYSLVWWIRADSPDLITADLAALAQRVRGERRSGTTDDEEADWATGWLQAHPGWLLVFDNAERPGDVHAVTGQLRSAGRYVVTTRYRHGWHAEPLALGVLDEESSLTLLTELSGDHGSDETSLLAEELGHLPLALEQAGSYVGRTGTSVSDYRALVATHPARMADAAPDGPGATDRTVARVWGVTVNQLVRQSPDSADVLLLASWYAPEGIPRALFAPLVGDAMLVDEAVATLADYSMITVNGPTFSVHRAVQWMGRTQVAEDPQRPGERIAELKEMAFLLLLKHFPEDPTDVRAWPECAALLPHVEALLDRLPPAEDGGLMVLLLHRAATYLLEQGSSAQTLRLCERLVEVAERVEGELDPITLAVRGNLAIAARRAGDPGRALLLEEKSVADHVRAYGPDDPRTLRAKGGLAAVWLEEGEVRRGAALEAEIHAGLLRSLGPDHVDTIVSLGRLAHAHSMLGEHERNRDLCEQAVERCLRIFGPDSPRTLLHRVNLASAHDLAGDAERSVTELRQALADCVPVLGAPHDTSLLARENLAHLLARLGEFAEAVDLFAEVDELTARRYGPESHRAVRTRATLERARARLESVATADGAADETGPGRGGGSPAPDARGISTDE
ncbi:FxSxx-COOH system tetratricopeptide repeat protein [Streptomyces sp. NPDC008125]|uniref:FxSxx-COOH system tetratricopeptide repeat protein n=1 Tax=Streptomyces sp. NPDC008125 TaxID=3364811 RepID=UPI0036E4EE9E